MKNQTVIATIKHIKSESYSLFVNDVREDAFFDYVDRVKCLKAANKVFDDELLHTAEKYKHISEGAFLWCYTAETLRDENIIGLLRIRFIQELIYLLASSQKGLLINIETYLPAAFLNDFSKRNISFKINTPKYIIYFLREKFRRLYHSFIALKKNIPYLFVSSNLPFNGILIDINSSPNSHRLDNLDNFQNLGYPIKYFSGQEHKITGFDSHHIIEFRKELTLSLFFKSIVQTLKVGLFLSKAKKSISPGISFFLSGIFDFRLADLVIYGLTADKFFAKSSIKHIVHVSTMTKPSYRLLVEMAAKNNVPFTLVSSRSLKILSSSERLLPCDISNYSNTHIPLYFIFRDNFSARVFQNYPQLKNRIFIGGRFNESIDLSVVEGKKEIVVLIMFTHIYKVCEKIMQEIHKLDLEKYPVDRIFFRSHPSAPIKKEKVEFIAGKIPVQDITGESYNKLKDFNVITISGPTTGTLEAVRIGSAILWIPYVWSDGILLDDFMNIIGKKCTNFLQLKHNFNLLISNSAILQKNIRQSIYIVNSEFSSSELISNQLRHILNFTTN
jgi:hypothetical protein